MIAVVRLRNFSYTASLVSSVLVLTSCAYRLPAFIPPSEEQIRIVANAPEQYTVQVNTGTIREYTVPRDGRIKIGIPPYRPSCGVYLFNVVKIGGYSDPLKSWTVSISRNGNTVRSLSLRDTQKYPTDEAGDHLLRFAY